MNLAFAVVFLWMGAAMLYLASHGLQSASPWAAFSTLLGKIRADG